jgi:hypothetical protein
VVQDGSNETGKQSNVEELILLCADGAADGFEIPAQRSRVRAENGSRLVCHRIHHHVNLGRPPTVDGGFAGMRSGRYRRDGEPVVAGFS